jgi:sugar phosphate isomerase/epimerase
VKQASKTSPAGLHEGRPPHGRLALREVMLPSWYSTFSEDVDACAGAGIAGISLWAPKLPRDEEVEEALRRADIQVAVSSLTVNSVLPQVGLPGPQDTGERLEQMCLEIERLGRLGAAGVVVLTGADASRPAKLVRQAVVEGVQTLARVAAQHGMTVGLEPVRFAEGASLISNLEETGVLVAEIATANVGIAFDVWHHWDSVTIWRDIEQFATQFNSVHVADWRDPPRGVMDRVLPGEGVIDLPRIFAALEAAGFNGWYELEVFSDEQFADSILHLSPNVLVRRARESFDAVWPRVSVTA